MKKPRSPLPAERALNSGQVIPSDEKFRLLVENANEAIIIAQDGKFKYVNKSTTELLHYPIDELISKPLGNFIHPDDKMMVLERYKIRLEGKSPPTGYEFRTLTREGDPMWVHINSILTEWEGSPAILIYLTDITAKKRIELQVKQKSEQLNNILETMTDAVATADFDGIVRFWNKGAEKIYGIPLKDILGKSILPYIPEERKHDFPYFIAETRQGRKIEGYETERIRPDGTRFFSSMNISPLKNADGIIDSILVIVHDITERYKAEETLKKSEEKFRLLAENASDVIWTLDINGKFLYMSPSVERVSGFTPEEAMNQPFEEILTKTGFGATYQNLIDNIASNNTDKKLSPSRFSLEQKCKDGSTVWTESTVNNIFNEEGKFLFFLGVTRDITERKKIENELLLLNQTLEKRVEDRTAKLESVNKDLESFAYSVSHDLRAPLRHIDGFSKLLKNSISPCSSETGRFLEKISKATVKMAIMIDELLNFSRLGRTAVKKSSVDLNVIVKQVIDQYASDITNRKIQFEIGNLPVVQGDFALLQIAFENLISNAIKFTSKKEKAVIEIFPGENLEKPCTVYIKDNGAGFDNAYIDKLFGVFQRLHTSEEFEGTGIGLANVKQIIKKHDGIISASGEVNQGATFYITL
ncbi:MAG: PAS domain S-box protein [Bacteroidales bacterium]|nr:PAS domain S-box protein [Bacteroidales bacterium]